jgi:hypothetical protein
MSTSQSTVVQDFRKCTICWEPVKTQAILMPCCHEYDFECILPWFQSIITANRGEVTLPCPLCRQHTKLIRHASTPSGRYSTFDPIMHFSRTERPGSGDQPQWYRGPLRDLIFMGATEDRLDMQRILAMGPHQTEAFVAFLRGPPSQVARLNKQHLRIFVERWERFLSLLGDAAAQARERPNDAISSFLGFTRQDTLDWDAIDRMNRDELARFRSVFRPRSWNTFEDRQRMYQRSFELENPAQRRDR